jgi:hypothetical protein
VCLTHRTNHIERISPNLLQAPLAVKNSQLALVPNAMNGPDANGTWLEDEDIAKWKKGFSLLPPIGLIQFLCPSVLATNHMSSATARISQDASRGLRPGDYGH